MGEKGGEEMRLWERSEGPLVFNLKDSVRQGFLLGKTSYSELQQGLRKRLEQCDVPGLPRLDSRVVEEGQSQRDSLGNLTLTFLL